MQNKLLKIARMGLALAVLVFAGALPALAQDCKGRMDRITEEEADEFSRKHEEVMAEVKKAWEVANGDADKFQREFDKIDLSKEEATANVENLQRVLAQTEWDLEEAVLEIINPFRNKSVSQEDLNTNNDHIEGGFADYWKNITPEQIQTCLNDGANINVGNNYGRTPLHNAVRFNKNPEVIMTLLRAGADITLKDKDGSTAFDWAGYNEALKGTDAYQALKDAQY